MKTFTVTARRMVQVLILLGGVTLLVVAINTIILRHPVRLQSGTPPSSDQCVLLNSRETSLFSNVSSSTAAGNSNTDMTQMIKLIRQCSQAERISHMQDICRHRYDVSRPALMNPSERSLVDHKHNITFCWMSKAGGTSLKAFILEANGLDLSKRPKKKDSLNLVHIVQTVNKYGLQQMYQLNKTQRRAIVDKYTNVMGIRHPFDRLVAYYRDKILDTDRSSNHPKRAAEILREYRPQLFKSNNTLSKMQWPQDEIGLPTFSEVFRWAYHHKQMDEHWNFIHEICHPCAHDWGAILRVETMQTDGELLAKLVHSNHSGVPVRHSHELNPNYSQFGKVLDQFADLPNEVLDYFLEFYRTDMLMFGYKWDKTTHTAYCSIDTPNGPCC